MVLFFLILKLLGSLINLIYLAFSAICVYKLLFKHKEDLEKKHLREHDLLVKLIKANYLKSDLIVTIRNENNELVLVCTNIETMEITEHHVKIENQELSVLKPA